MIVLNQASIVRTMLNKDDDFPSPHRNIMMEASLQDVHADKPPTTYTLLKKKTERGSLRILPDTAAASDPRGSHATEPGGFRGNE